jgi:hypothetical protein
MGVIMRLGKNGLVILVVSFGLVMPAWAKKGDIVPEKKKGVSIRETSAGPVASVKTDEYQLDVIVTSAHGVLTVQAKLTNNGSTAIQIRPETCQMYHDDAPLDPLDPHVYAQLASDAKPYEVDRDGKILTNEVDKLPDDVPTSKNKIWRKSKGKREMRMAITKDVIALKKDILMRGGIIEAGESKKGRLVYQRNGLELPFEIRFSPEGVEKPLVIRYVRAR